MDAKDWIAIGALAVSVVSAWAAIDARDKAAELADREFVTDKTLEILASVYREILDARTDAERAKWSCFFISSLGAAEAQARKEPPFFVRTFVEDVSKAGLWQPDCAARLEAVVSDAVPAATEIPAIRGAETATAAAPAPRADAPVSIGAWHALIASYNVTAFGCGQAKDDVGNFARLLSGHGLDGSFVYVVRTQISNNYAVTVDAGSDRELASRISAAVRSVAPPDGTGRDSFVQGNRGWSIDPACERFARVEG
jgi:hypothetical protein